MRGCIILFFVWTLSSINTLSRAVGAPLSLNAPIKHAPVEVEGWTRRVRTEDTCTKVQVQRYVVEEAHKKPDDRVTPSTVSDKENQPIIADHCIKSTDAESYEITNPSIR